MIKKSFDKITKEDVEFLLSNETPESKTMEYKLILPKNSDVAKKEFLADISSFANASGGDILYGVSEKEGIPIELPGLEKINLDQEQLRIENMIRDNVEPRIPGVRVRGIDGFAKGPVLHIRVPNSWVSPHMVTFKTSSRFFSRSSAEKFPMDVTEIRTAFAETEELPVKIERFIDGRLGKIIAGETPVPLTDNPKIILHVLPFSSFGRGSQISVPEQKKKSQLLRLFYGSGYDSNVNVDGLITFDSAKTSYCQMFRAGQIESLDAGVLEIHGDKKTIPSTYIVRSLRGAIQSYLQALKDWMYLNQ
jgi:hypothetical protein